MVGLSLPTTCGCNIICNPLLYEKACVSLFFIMFDFAMTLSHKRVHNFFAWSFVHCTALPIVIFFDGNVCISNDSMDGEDSVVVLSWGREGGVPESKLNTQMKKLEQNITDRKERDNLCNRIVDKISLM